MLEKPYYVKTEMSGRESSRHGSVWVSFILGGPVGIELKRELGRMHIFSSAFLVLLPIV